MVLIINIKPYEEVLYFDPLFCLNFSALILRNVFDVGTCKPYGEIIFIHTTFSIVLLDGFIRYVKIVINGSNICMGIWKVIG